MRPSPLQSPLAEETGSATVLSAFLVATLVAVTGAGLLVGEAVLARHRAQAAADLAALAGARRLFAGPDAACRHSLAVGTAMGAVVRSCDVEHLDIVITCEVRLPGWSGGGSLAAARAGPV